MKQVTLDYRAHQKVLLASKSSIGRLEVAVYATDIDGLLIFYNQAATNLWGRKPELGKDQWCGSWKILNTNGSPMPLDTCPLATCLKEERPLFGQEIIIERPDGSFRHVASYPRPFYNRFGRMIGATNTLLNAQRRTEEERIVFDNEGLYHELEIGLEEIMEAEAPGLKGMKGDLPVSDATYHKMIEEVEDYAIILLDGNGIVQNWNKGAEKIKGYQKHEIVGKSFITFYLPEDRESGLPQLLLNQAKESGKAIHEGWRMRKDGIRFWGSIVLTALHDDSGGIIGFSKVTRDLTEKKLADDQLRKYSEDLNRRSEELRKREERYHKMIEEVEDYAIILLDREGIIQNWNKGAEKIKGYKQEEIVGKNFSNFYLPEDRASQLPQRLLAQATNFGKALHEGWRLKKDGSRFWGSIVLTALHDDNGNILGFSKVTRDLTERKLADDRLREYTDNLNRRTEELRRSEERYHKMIEEVEDYAIILLDKEGIIQNWNKGAEKIKGYKQEEIVGKSFSNFYLPEDRDAGLPQTLLSQARKFGKAVHEGWRMRKDGSRFWGSIVLTALHDTHHHLIGFSKVTRDLTERKLTEDQLREYADQLEFQNKELEQFAYAASHDMKEPLRKIHLYNSFIAENSANVLDEQSREFLNRSIKAANRLTGLIEDLLTYSKTTTNFDSFEMVNLNEIVDEIQQMHKEESEQIGVTFQVDPLPVIFAIRFQIRQLIFNLVNNAIKYRHPDRVLSIVIQGHLISGADIPVEDADSNRNYYKISVSDNGLGFDPQFADKIFMIFHRLANHSTRGSGIGLAICKKIVQNHDGIIKATGKINEGAQFDMYFPETYHSVLLQ